ncbi:GIY-YIG nuclease family protein [Clostridium sp. KNHs214]|uniref:GIY-YIG nuclease family protein n=1 Tax=Clostridium sp. KNHs214 TaxID=1540257 RepID=UPI00068B6600|nr:GIY-YIG nuclease family protein [Clostridium sp. KNHs214]
MKMKVCGIYGVEDVKTGNIYVGRTGDIGKRWSNHSSFLKSGVYRYKELQEAYNNDCKRIKYTILEECNKSELQEREDWWIKYIEKIDGWTVINKQKHGGNHGGSKVKDTSKMCKAQQGENNGHCTKLCESDVKEIKKLLKKGVSQKELARQYNVSPTHINNIYKGKRWGSVKIEEKSASTPIDTLEKIYM